MRKRKLKKVHAVAAGLVAIAGTSVGTAYVQSGSGHKCTRSYLPDHVCTPGLTNPDVSQENIDSTICVSGYTASIRPPVSESNRLKKQAAGQYGISPFDPSQFEGDHLISLELGGAPDDIRNFWDEPHSATGSDGGVAGSSTKDRFENYLNKQVCSGTMTLAVAQSTISGDWYAAYIAAGRP